MGTSDSKPQNTESSGDFSNANSNSITIVETLENHSSSISAFLIVIVVILVIHLTIKIYKMNKKSIQKKERAKSRTNISSV